MRMDSPQRWGGEGSDYTAADTLAYSLNATEVTIWKMFQEF
jgi:aspartokinase